ncbi:polysaccharide deacetylase family protein [Marinobacter sp. X15-166B]|uniref:polysaccharide deacetylase family protein n=1 Tax=Marinobacter sp. X15-166B TaxID=1897620 RepID=UPI00085C4829|nr:polysaccharide deacetylase family protein [Marinobacter sp. X15-166B]OEY67178.1 polysaccharide deacetylase [Marinobacter sp. X15-166B]
MQLSIFHRVVALSLLLASSWARADLVVLQYHHIDDSTPPSTSTTPSLFDAQLALIDELGLEVVPLDTATRDALAGRSADRQQVAITFDDAHASVLTAAAPRLARKNFPYTIFVNTQAIGQPGYLNWQQLDELNRQPGVTIANHSADHGHLARRLNEPQEAWLQRVQTSMDTAQETLRKRLGVESTLFAYPYGEFDRDLEALVAARGWLGYGQHSGAIGASSHPTRLPRFPMANAYGQLNALTDKLRSKALPVDAGDLPDGVIDAQQTGGNPPRLRLTLPETLAAGRLSCFASRQGRIAVTAIGKHTVSVVAPESFNSRRFRYNCTYPAGAGRYYWFSQPWLDLSQPED